MGTVVVLYLKCIMRIVTHEIYRDFTIILIIFAVSSDLTISLHFFVTEKARSPCACDAVSQSAVGARLCRRSHSHTNATAGSLPHSAVAAALATTAAVAGPIAFAVIVPGAGGLINCVAVSECIADIIGSAAHGDNDDDNDDDDDQEGDADAERAADTASAETGLGGLGSFVAG